MAVHLPGTLLPSKNTMQTANQNWYALRATHEFDVANTLRTECSDVYLPVEQARTADGTTRTRPLISRVLFVRDTETHLLQLEKRGHDPIDPIQPFWIYRYERGGAIQPVKDTEMQLLRLLSATDSTRCEIYTRTDFHAGQAVEVIAGPFAGYRGHVRRIQRNRHVIVEIEGICAIALPFIHPDLLSPLP